MKLGTCLWVVGLSFFAMAEGKEPRETPSPFGIGSCHIHGRSVEDFERWLPQIAETGLRFHRSLATGWGAVEPEQGKWNWETVDAQAAYLDRLGMEYGALLIGSPGWNKAVPPGHLPVGDLPGWSEYVSQTVKHLRGKVSYFEVWNEPPNFTGRDQTPDDYAKIVVAAYDAAKAANPDCKVGLAAKSAHILYLEQVIRAGAKDHFDWITLHPYEILDGIVDNSGMEPVYLNIVPTVRRMLAAVNPKKVDVPVFFTELGCDAVRHGADAQAHAVVKAYAMGIAQGVTCVQWFEGRDGDSGPLGLIDGDGNPRPALHALGRMIGRLGPRPEYLGWVLLNGRNHGFIYQGAKGAVLVAWAPKGDPDRVSFSREVEIIDPPTGKSLRSDHYELTVAPVFILDPPADLVKAARANRTRPVPWGGDFTKAESVSVTMGADGAEKGLHTRAGAAVAQAVAAYGGSARAGNIPGGNMFVVDPGFLTYDKQPLEISAEVRRKEENENAGFKLVYESTTGFKTAGSWYTIPDNQQWHTVTWRIDDPCFVNYWGYNFLLESDGDQYNKYYLRRVTVKKLRDVPAAQ